MRVRVDECEQEMVWSEGKFGVTGEIGDGGSRNT